MVKQEGLFSLKFIKDFGWQLQTNETGFRCFECKTLLSLPFIFCSKSHRTFCVSCNKKVVDCQRIDKNAHEHFKIMRIEGFTQK